MKTLVRPIVSRLPGVKRLRHHFEQQLESQRVEIERLTGLLKTQQLEKQGAWPAGHYYSPIPDRQEALQHVSRIDISTAQLTDVELNESAQLQLLEEYSQSCGEPPFPEHQSEGFRYYFENSWFSYGDATFLYAFLRKNLPKRIVEVGSGLSSAVMLDTIDRYFPSRPQLTFIEPEPERLKSILKDGDDQSVQILESRVQDAPVSLFQQLDAGDLLFIDSSHVLKCGSDLQHLLFQILPLLKAGVFVHFHDIFYPFEYPPPWIEQGHYWNECYMLRAFLAYNESWKIRFFNCYLHMKHPEILHARFPLVQKNHGGSIYIQRVAP